MNTARTVASVVVEAKILRADGTVEDLGTIAHWHKNPLTRVAYEAKQFLKELSDWGKGIS